MSRGPAIWATALAVGFVNVGLAAIIVGAIGQRSFAPVWVGGVLVIAGVAAAVAALVLWRRYLDDLRGD
jgi:membrane protein implicated in regulation of membrane protease activity